jgi:hypothetical protein
MQIGRVPATWRTEISQAAGIVTPLDATTAVAYVQN